MTWPERTPEQQALPQVTLDRYRRAIAERKLQPRLKPEFGTKAKDLPEGA